MLFHQMFARRFHVVHGVMISCLSLALLGAPVLRAGAQAADDAAPAAWSAWVFGRAGVAQTSQVDTHGRDGAVLGSVAAGIGASRGALLGIARATVTAFGAISDFKGTSVQDYAVLAGLRSRGEHLFVAGAAGLAQATQSGGENSSGFSTSHRLLAPAYDLSAHADYRVAGLALSLSGVLSPKTTRYVAVSLGAELGWFRF